MYKTKNLGLNITEIEKDKLQPFSFKIDLGDNFEAIDSKTVTHRNITNCLLEVPQRIKYTLEDGTLTIKAGSVVIVPYGTEDLTSQYPVGSTFLNDNFKVYDTQFANSKFFVWVELVSDRVGSYQNASTALQFLMIRLNIPGMVTRSPNVVSSGTNDTTSSTTYHGFYNTSDNLIRLYDTTGLLEDVVSFPLFLLHGDGTNLYSYIDNVFNGFGYIGSALWCDKGIKGLTPNGYNLDGSINNIVQETKQLFTYTLPSDLADNSYIPSLVNNFGGEITGIELKAKHRVNYSNEKPADVNNWWFHIKENQWKYIESSGQITKRWWLDCGVFDMEQGVIKSFTTNNSFQAVDYNEYQSKIAELEAKIEALQNALQG